MCERLRRGVCACGKIALHKTIPDQLSQLYTSKTMGKIMTTSNETCLFNRFLSTLYWFLLLSKETLDAFRLSWFQNIVTYEYYIFIFPLKNLVYCQYIYIYTQYTFSWSRYWNTITIFNIIVFFVKYLILLFKQLSI